MSVRSVLDYLEVQSSFRLQTDNVNGVGYNWAINELNKLRHLSSPMEKLVRSKELCGQDNRVNQNSNSEFSQNAN